MQNNISSAGIKNKPPYLNLMNQPDLGQIENELFNAEGEINPLGSLSNRGEANPSQSKGNGSSNGKDNSFFLSFLPEFIQSIKTNLISIKNISLLSMEKFNDVEFKKYSHKSIEEDIKKIDSVLNSLLNYIHINTPIAKSNTISMILNEVLEGNEKQIRKKNIKVFKKYEDDLPETFIHDEQVRFILNSVLQYAILSSPGNGTIAFLIKSFDFHNGGEDRKASTERMGGYIEAAIGFVDGKKQTDPSKEPPVKSDDQKDETTKLILQLVKDVLDRNRGSLTYEADPKKPKTIMTLRFPIEKRKVVYYEPISI